MARNTTVTLTAGAWTAISDTAGAITAITFQNRGLPGNLILEPLLLVKATATAVAPSDETGAIEYKKGEGQLSSTALSVLWPGISGGYVYGKSTDAISVMVSHA